MLFFALFPKVEIRHHNKTSLPPHDGIPGYEAFSRASGAPGHPHSSSGHEPGVALPGWVSRLVQSPVRCNRKAGARSLGSRAGSPRRLHQAPTTTTIAPPEPQTQSPSPLLPGAVPGPAAVASQGPCQPLEVPGLLWFSQDPQCLLCTECLGSDGLMAHLLRGRKAMEALVKDIIWEQGAGQVHV